MDKEELKKYIESNYNIKVQAVEKVKNSYRIGTENGDYAIKIIKYDFPHFYFILSAMEHLQKKKFSKIPMILNNVNGSRYVKLEKQYAYLTEWIPSRVSNYDNPIELAKVAQKLGELHNCSTNFNINKQMRPRIGWYSWIKVFNTRCDEILDFKNRINQKAYKSNFDYIYLKSLDDEIKRGKRAIQSLISHRYMEVMDKEVKKFGFCHHDFAHHNILIDEKGELNIIDFDYCILDSHLHDLSSLLIRVMKGAKWSKEKANLIIDNYCKTNDLSNDEFKLMGDFISFPQAFWQIGLQYYWEQQPWGEKFFEDKINKYLDDIEYREEFIESYFQ